MSLSQAINYNVAANFLYDSDLIDINVGASGLAQLKDLTPTNESFFAPFAAGIDGYRGLGVLTGTATGGAGVSGGYLDLSFGDARYVTWDADLNADSQQVGCFNVVWQPNYSGAPSANQVILSNSKAHGDLDNLIEVYHIAGSGGIQLKIYNSASGAIIITNLGTWTPVAGTDYEFELNYDITTGATRLFIDGVQHGTTQTGTGTRDASIAMVRTGRHYNGITTANFKVAHFQVFSAVQHTANYTPVLPSDTLYSTATPSILVKASFQMDDLDGLTETTVSTPAGTALRYTLRIDGQDYWWNGSAVATTDGATYAETNDAATIVTNKAAFTALFDTSGSDVQLRVFLSSTTGDARPSVTTVTMDFNFNYVPSDPAFCIVSGEIVDVGNSPTVSAVVQWIPNPHFFYGPKLVQQPKLATVDLVEGSWSISVLENDTYGGSYDVIITTTDANGEEYVSILRDVEVPNQNTENIDNIAEVA